MTNKEQYSLKIGLGKTIKNVGITWVIPILAVLLNNYQSWLPEQYVLAAAPIMGAISYLIKNFIENK